MITDNKIDIMNEEFSLAFTHRMCYNGCHH